MPEQEEARRLLEAALAEGPAHAYLFHGPSGVGKGTAALAFARAMLCEHGAPRAAAEPSLFDAAPAPAAAATAPDDDLCGVCAACTKTATLQIFIDLIDIFRVHAARFRGNRD